MTEIEKMFENANAYEMLCNCEFKNLYDYRIEYGSDVCDYTESKIKEPCKVCEKAKQKIKYYPDFTTEKQLEIENVILQNKKNYNKWIEYNINVYGEWVIRFVRTDKFAPYIALGKTRAEAFANVINHFWQSLTDQEKEEIRRILNAR